MKKEFKWAVEAMIPDTATLPFPVLGTDHLPIFEDGKPKSEEITFTELPRIKLKEFLQEQEQQLTTIDKEKPIMEDNVQKTNSDGQLLFTKRPLQEVTEASYAFIAKWAAEMTNSAKKPTYFTKLGEHLGVNYWKNLVVVLMELNHVDEVLATGGNLMWLPMVSQEEPEKKN